MKSLVRLIKNNVYIFLTIMVLIISCCFVLPITIVYAAIFSSSVIVGGSSEIGDLTVETGEISSLVAEYAVGDLSFSNAGDKKSISLSLSNNLDDFLQYYYKISLTGSNNDLASAVLVYFDDNYLGMLNEIVDEDYTFGNCYILPKLADVASTDTHTLTFELHIGASGSTFSSKTATVKVTSYAGTIDYQSGIIVSDETEWNAAIQDINRGILGAKIILTDDISLTSDYEIKNPCDIDLFGNELNFLSNNVSFTASGQLNVQSSKLVDYSALSNDNIGGFIVNGDESLILIDDIYNTGRSVNVGKLYANGVTITDYDSSAIKEYLFGRLNNNVTFLKGNESKDVFGATAIYTDKVGLANSSGLSYSNGSITATDVTDISYQSITLDPNGSAQTINIKVYPSTANSAILADILSNELAHIPQNINESIPSISYDLFLPTALRNRNVSIIWHTSNPALMTVDGRIGSELGSNPQVTLTAEIRVNNEVFTEQFTFVVYSQNNELKFTYLIAQMNPITLSDIYPATPNAEAYLPVVDDLSDFDYRKAYNQNGVNGCYAWSGYNDIGLTSLTYSLSSEFNYITLGTVNDSVAVYLNSAVFYSGAQISVHGVFADGEEFDGVLNVSIELGDDAGLQQIVFDYLDGILSEINVLDNIIATRKSDGMADEKGDFVLPTTYQTYSLEYQSLDVSDVVSGVIDNGDGTATIHINPEKFLNTDSNVGIKVLISIPGLTDDSQKPSRTLRFTVPGALHYSDASIENKSIFDSIKYQVFQQLDTSEKGGNSGYTISGNNLIYDFDNYYDYILLRDLEYCETLAFSNNYSVTSPESGLLVLLGWAIGADNSTITANSAVLGSNISLSSTGNTVSNGKTYISDDEKAAIKEYCISAGFTTSAEFDILWTQNTTTSDTYEIVDSDTLAAGIKSALSGSGTFFMKYTEMMQWATAYKKFSVHNSDYGAYSSGDAPNWSYFYGDSYLAYVLADEYETISEDEYNVVVCFLGAILTGQGENSSYSTLQDAWNNCELKTTWEECIIKPTYFTTAGKNNLYQSLIGVSAVPPISTSFSTIPTTEIVINNAGSTINYLQVTDLDSLSALLPYFTNLKRLYISKSANDSLPLFVNSQSITTFFNRLTNNIESLVSLEMINASIVNETSLDISSLNKLLALKYLNLSGCSGIEDISVLTKTATQIAYVDIYGVSIENDYLQDSLAYIWYRYADANPDSVHYVYYSNNGVKTAWLPTANINITAVYLLNYLSGISSVKSENLQLTSRIYSSSGATDVAWKIEKGNGIEEISYADNPANTATVLTSSNALQMQATYFYDASTWLGNSTYRLYQLTYENDTYSLTRVNTRIYTSGTTNNRYYYNSSTMVIYYRRSSSNYNKISLFISLTQSEATNIDATMKQRYSEIYKCTTDIAAQTYYNTFSTTASATTTTLQAFSGTTANPTFYRFSHNGSTIDTNTVSATELNSIVTMQSLVTNASQLTYGNYYLYTGQDTVVSGMTYQNYHVYRLLNYAEGYKMAVSADGADIYGNAMDKSDTCEIISDYDSLMQVNADSGYSELNNVYKYTGSDYNTYGQGNIYEIANNASMGIYYLKVIGAVSFAESNGALKLINDRNYNGDNYAGTGGSETVIISATISIDDVDYIKKFKFTVKGFVNF